MTSTLNQPEETRSAAPRANFLTPLANILETAEGYVLEAEMPGVSKEGLEVHVNNGELVIVGRRTPSARTTEPVYRESRGWDYRRTFEIDHSVDVTKIVARMDQGVLRLQLPRAESVKPRRIEVTD